MLEILKDILNKGRFGNIKNNIAYLEEKDKEASLTLIKVSNITDNDILLSLDKADSQTFYQKGKGQNKRCDYILLHKNIAYFIELKSDEEAQEKYTLQVIEKFKATECVLDYIDSVIYKIYGEEKIFSNLEKRYILIYKAPSINKLPINNKKTRSHNLPENMLKLPLENEQEIDVKFLS